MYHERTSPVFNYAICTRKKLSTSAMSVLLTTAILVW
jgi:hypothetical protein